MEKRTHLAVGLGIGLYFMPFVNHKISLIPLILIASMIPDIDLISSTLGKKKIFRPIQIMFQHRGPFHSYTFCFLLALIFAFFIPSFALPVFLGYSFHILLDSFTPQGIPPFWPLKTRMTGMVKTGSVADKSLFLIFLLVDLFLLIMLFMRI